MENKLPNTPKGSPKTEINIAGFSILLDAVRVFNTRQEQTEKSNKAIQKGLDALIKSQSKQEDRNDSIASKLDALTKSNEKLIDSVEEQTKVVKEDAERAGIAEESITEKENEKLFLEEVRTRKDEKDRTEIISKLSALEKKDLSVNIMGGGSGGLGGLMSSLLELAAIVGTLGAAFIGLKKFLESLYSGDIFDPSSRRVAESAAAAVGASRGSAAGKTGSKVLASAREDLARAKSGKASPGTKPGPTTRDVKTGRFVKGKVPTATPLERIGLGAKGVAKGVVGTGMGLASTVKSAPKSLAAGAVIGGAADGILAYESGAGGIETTKAVAKGAFEGATTAAGFHVAAGLASTAGAMVGGTTATIASRAVPILGWGLLGYDLIKTAYSSGSMARNSVNASEMNALFSGHESSVEAAKAIYEAAEAYKESDPKEYDKRVKEGNRLISSSTRKLMNHVNMVDTENALDKIVDINKMFENGPFGSWDRGPNYGILSLMGTLRDLEKVPGNNVTQKLQEVTANPTLYPINGLSALLENIGQNDTIKLLTNASPVINKFLENQSKDPMVYFEEKLPEWEAAGKAAAIEAAKPQKGLGLTRGMLNSRQMIEELSRKSMAEGAALIHSKSPMGVPVMAGEQGNPETIIPLKKFDKVISSYLGQKELNLQIEPKSYSDVITNGMRDSYLEEKMQNNGAMTPVIINNNTTTRGGGEGGGTNYQYQTDLSRTYDNTFDMILEKNMRLGLP